MEHDLLVWFCNPHDTLETRGENAFDTSLTTNQLSADFWFEGDLVQSCSVSTPMLTNVEKTINLKVKNPLNFMADYNTLVADVLKNPVATQPMGDAVPTGWENVVVSDSEFILFKGTMADWLRMTDAQRTKALLGIFYVEKVTYDEVAQNYTIQGRDAMAIARRWAVWDQPLKFPPEDATADIYVGQIVHYLFHWIGCWHRHLDGIAYRSVLTKTKPTVKQADIPDIALLYSTNMKFMKDRKRQDEQIAENELVGDVWNTLLTYTGYKIYVQDEIVSGIPRSVFVFEPPAYKLYNIGNTDVNDTLNLFGSYTANEVQHDVTVINSLFLPTSTTHWNPITITGITHTQDVDPVRRYVKVRAKTKTVLMDDPQFVGVTRMRGGGDRTGVVIETSIDDVDAPGVAESILFQIRELYTSVSITFSDAVKFAPRLYTFAIDETAKGINVQVNGVLQCVKNEITWTGTKWETTAGFTPSNILQKSVTQTKDLLTPIIDALPSDKAALVWWSSLDPTTTNGTIGYNLECRIGSTSGDSTITNLSASGTVVEELTNGTKYYFRAQVLVDAVASAWSSWVEVTPFAYDTHDVLPAFDAKGHTIFPAGARAVGTKVIFP